MAGWVHGQNGHPALPRATVGFKYDHVSATSRHPGMAGKIAKVLVLSLRIVTTMHAQVGQIFHYAKPK